MKKISIFLMMLCFACFGVANAQTTSFFSEDFEGGSMPSGWTTDGPGTWSVGSGDNSSSTGAGQGTYNALITHGTSGNVTKLITPEIDLSSADWAKLSFMHIQRSWAGDIDQLRVYYRTSSSGSWTQLVAYTNAFASWTTESGIALSDFSSTYQLAFEFTDNYGYGVGLDDINIEGVIASCPMPTNLHIVGEVGPRSVTVGWDAESGATFQYAMVQGHNIDPTVVTTFDGTTSTNQMTWNNLTPDTDYTVVLRKVCGTNDYSTAIALEIHTTVACPAPTLALTANSETADGATLYWTGSSQSYTMQYIDPATATISGYTNGNVTLVSEGFEDGSMPTGWTIEGDGTWTVGSGNNGSISAAHTGSYNAKATHVTRNNNTYLIMPAMDLSQATSATISLWYSNEVWPNDTDGFGVYYRVNGGSWNQLFYTTTSHDTWTEIHELALTGLAANYEIGFLFNDQYGYGVTVDDIEVNAVMPVPEYVWNTASNNATSPYIFNTLQPGTSYWARVIGNCGSDGPSNPSNVVSFTTLESCPTPQNLAVTTDGATATATWTGTANTYNIEINGTPSPNNPITGTSHTFNVELSTTYTVRVQANCNGGEISTWSDPVSFTTPVCVGGHEIEYTLNDSYGDGWNGNAIVIVDGCGNVIETLTIENGSSNSGTLNLCGSYYQFTWAAGSYANETSFTLTDNGTAIYTSQSGSSLTDGQVLHTIGTLVPAPTNLTAGTPGTNSVVLNWTAGGSETSWQICINGDESNLITANTNVDYLLSNLDLDTDYTVKVRAYINANSQSCWSNTVSFTTEASSCPKPTNVTASNVTINSANISWNGEADSYNVQYATATVTGTTLETVFFDDFENGFGNWTTYALGDYTDDTWALTNSTLVDSYHSGSYGALTRSYYNGVDVSVDNWLVSPQMTLGDVLKFWVVGDNNNYQEYFAVYVSTGTNATSDFVMVEAPELAPGDGTWAERTVDLSAYAGQVGYIAIRHTDFAQDFLILDDFGVYKTVNTYSHGTFTTLPPTSETSSDITGLSPETLYVAQVQADCGGTDGTSSWSSVYFTTPDACSAPTDLVTSDITATTATLGWSDNQDSYNVRYRKVYFFESFEGENLPSGWTTIDANEDGNTWGIGHATTHSGNNGASNFSYIYNVTGTEPDDYLVSPQLDLQGTLRVWLSGITASTYAEHFEILLSTTENSASDFTTTLVAEAITTNEYVEYTADLSSYAGQQGYIAIHHFNCTDQRYLYVDDFGLYGSENWVTVNPNPTSGTTNLTGLTPNVGYEWQVQGLNCNTAGSATDWSAVATFTTLAQYQKTIAAVDETEWAEGKGGYYLIASPLANDVDPTTIGMTTGDYDLYSFDQAEADEWRNYTVNNFDLVNGQGYLYASKEGTTLTFTGAAGTNGTVTLSKTNDNTVDFQGWNLVGNPFGVEAYINKPFYTLENSDTYTENTAGTAIQLMQGLFVVADNDGETLTFSTVAPSKKVAKLNMNVSKGNSVVDHAILSFSEGQQLPKLQFRKNSTKVYMPMEGKDYAIVSTESNVGEMPVNFKAENNGTYTLSFTTEEVSFAYLHLIDNMTGIETDLLATPSYSFEAKTTDYESRFKLVFATGNNDNDAFAFYSNGSFVINNEGNATLQVIDINGRILKSESINGCTNVNVKAAAGVYMLRLVNGNDVKVQKVVVR